MMVASAAETSTEFGEKVTAESSGACVSGLASITVIVVGKPAAARAAVLRRILFPALSDRRMVDIVHGPGSAKRAIGTRTLKVASSRIPGWKEVAAVD